MWCLLTDERDVRRVERDISKIGITFVVVKRDSECVAIMVLGEIGIMRIK